MQIQYSKQNGKASEICISAEKGEWMNISKAIQSTAPVPCLTDADPSPYEANCVLFSIKIVASQNVVFSVLGDVLQVEGCAESLTELSNAIISFAQEYKSGEHFHLDFIDSSFISEESAFVVLCMN